MSKEKIAHFRNTDRNCGNRRLHTCEFLESRLVLSAELGTTDPPDIQQIQPDTGISDQDGITKFRNLTISGTGCAGDTVVLTSGTTQLGTSLVDDQGSWTIQVRLNLGATTLTATARRDAELSEPSAPFSVLVDQDRPATPIIVGAQDDDFISNGGSSSVKRPEFFGVGEVGSQLKLSDARNRFGKKLTGSDGIWTNKATLSGGKSEITATQRDIAGNVSPASDPFVVSFFSDNVRLRRNGRSLDLIGDGGSNDVKITLSENQVRVEGLSGTSVNGRESTSLGEIDHLMLSLGNGSDSVTIAGSGPIRSVIGKLDGGNDTLHLEGVTAKNVSVRGGSGKDETTLRDSRVERQLTAKLGSQKDSFTAIDTVLGSLNLDLAEGSDEAKIARTLVNDGTTMKGGNGNDRILINDSFFDGGFSLQTGRGSDSVVLDGGANDLPSVFDNPLISLGIGNDVLVLGEPDVLTNRVGVISQENRDAILDGGSGTDEILIREGDVRKPLTSSDALLEAVRLFEDTADEDDQFDSVSDRFQALNSLDPSDGSYLIQDFENSSSKD